MASPDREKWIDVFDTPYSNGSNTAANGLFLALTCLSLVGCVVITWRTRRHILFSYVLCVAYVLEIATYAFRFQGWNFTAFSIQYGLSTTAPIFVTIAIHLATAEATAQLGPEHAPLSPAAHLRTFIWTDIACLCIQALGLSLTFSGARAAGPWGLMLPARAHTGQTILFVGLLLQTLALAGALAVLAVTYVRASKADRTRGSYATFHRRGSSSGGIGGSAGHRLALSPRCKVFLAALPLAGACVLVRCAYRSAAAWGGIGSPIAKDLLLWLVAEGALLTEAMVSLAVFHPALCLDNNSSSISNRSGGGGGGRTRSQDLEAGRQQQQHVIGKRYSSGTTMSMADMYERKTHEQLQHDLGEGSQLMFSSNSNIMAPSEAGSSDGAGSRRASAGRVLDADPYYHYEDPFASPHEVQTSPYEAHYYHREPITTTAAAAAAPPPSVLPLSPLSPSSSSSPPLEADAAADRLETESFVQPPRKSSKRQSRALSPTEAQLAAEAEDYLDAESSFVVMMPPPRKSSKRVPVPVVPGQAQPQSAPARGLSVRSDESDQLEVASFVLPSRKPSKMSTRRGVGGDEDLDGVSLYSQ